MKPQNDHAIWFILFVFLAFLVGNFIFTQVEIAQIKNTLTESGTIKQYNNLTVSPASTPTSSPANSPNTAIQPSSTPIFTSATPKAIAISTNAPVANTKITYIPLTGGSTQNTDWTDVNGSQFTLSISDYGSKPYAVWDANLRVDNANGTTFARLFDKTHSIAVDGSEINISNTSTSTDVVSGQLNFWSGNNTYVVQLKSLNSSTAYIDSGRIKISY